MSRDAAVFGVAMWIFLGAMAFMSAGDRLESCPPTPVENHEKAAPNKGVGNGGKTAYQQPVTAFSQHFKERYTATVESQKPSAEPSKFCQHIKMSDLVVAFFAWLTLGLGLLQIYYLHGTLSATATNAAAARDSADIAFKATMPILMPYISGANLHPLVESITWIGGGPGRTLFTSSILFTFDNAGKSPAVIRDIRADLFLLPQDNLPGEILFDELPYHGFQPIIPGNTRLGRGTTSAIDWKKDFDISPEEFAELKSDAGEKFQRMALIGKVIYDDFFGWRHMRKFCVKMRYWRVKGEDSPRFFQSQFGGHAYTKVDSYKIPNPDPLEKV